MCRRLIEALLLVLAMGVAVTRAAAQDRPSVEADLAEYTRLLDSHEAGAQEQQAEALTLMERHKLVVAGRLDTLAVGPFQVVTWQDQRDAVTEVVRSAWERDFGPSDLGWVRDAVSGRTLVVHLTEMNRAPLGGTYGVAGEPGEHLDRQLSRTIQRMLVENLSPEFRAWMGAEHLQGAPSDAALYRIMVLSGESVVRDCALGDIGACRTLVGLDGGDVESWVGAWFDGEKARARAMELTRGDPQWRLHEATVGCRDLGSPEACLEALAWFDAQDLLPLRGVDRADLVRHALDVGGEGSMGRLIAAQGAPPTEILKAASGMELDALLADWVRDLGRDASSQAGPTQRRARTTALGWVMLFAFLSMKSTRWRLG